MDVLVAVFIVVFLFLSYVYENRVSSATGQNEAATSTATAE